jgi:colanic acid biosynthesis glycosyl transferase WcaI
MKLLFITQWFEPEPSMKGLAFVKALHRRGMECEVVTGCPNYPGGKVYPGYKVRLFQTEHMDGVLVNRLPIYPSHDRSSRGRILNYLSFFFSTLVYLLARGRRYDAILAYHPPITPAFAAALLCNWNRTPFAIDVQDLWPDSVAESGMPATRFLSRLLTWVCDYTYRAATLISVQSEGFRDKLVQRGVPMDKIRVIYNWADEDAVEQNCVKPPNAPQAERAEFLFVYAGNLGAAQDLGCLIEAAEMAAKTNDRIRLVLIGNGIEFERISERAALSKGIAAVRPGVPKSEIGGVLANADVLVAHLKQNSLYDMTIPSKLQFYMAVGRPVLCAIGGQAGDLILRSGGGLTAKSGDSAAISQAMLAMANMTRAELDQMGRRAQADYQGRFAFDRGLEATTQMLQDLMVLERR